MSNDDLSKTADSVGESRATVSDGHHAGWERGTLEELARATLKEQRLRRRWSNFFRLTTLALVIVLLWLIFGRGATSIESVGPHTALIEIDGVIDSDGRGSADSVIPALNKAYADVGAVGIILLINSPGGSPVQAGIINDEMQRLRKEYPNKPLYVVVEEVCASGGYYVAVAADRIYVNKASIVGSIGVLMDGFGLTGLIDKLGIERRLITAGENKGFLDPFLPMTAQQKKHAEAMLNEIHQQFIKVVREGRGQRLKETPETFSGLFWSGAKAVELGLVDGFGSVDSVARDVLKAEEVIDYTEREGLPERVLKKFGAAVGSGAAKTFSGSLYPALR
jgi:protease-4